MRQGGFVDLIAAGWMCGAVAAEAVASPPAVALCGASLELLEVPCGPGVQGTAGAEAVSGDGAACVFDLCGGRIGRWKVDGAVEWFATPLPLMAPRAINAAGQIVATSLVIDLPADHLLSDGAWSMLAPPPGKFELPPDALVGSAKAVDLNDAATVVGWWSMALPFQASETRVCMWTAEGFIDLGDVFELPNQMAAAVSGSGAIVGNVAPFEGPPLAFIYGPRYGLQPLELGTGGATGVSDNDIVVGTEGNAAWIWIDGRRTPLPLPSGAVLASVDAVNVQAVVVGNAAALAGEAARPAVWVPDGATWRFHWLHDLAEVPPDVVLQDARDLSNSGAIVGLAAVGAGTAAYRATLRAAPQGDLDVDCLIGSADLGILLASWGPCSGCPADLDGDGTVDGTDLGALLSAWPTE